MKQYVARTMTENCIGGLGGFGGLFELDCTGIEHPVLISGTDGVGTKLRVAQYMNKHDTIGIDCVASVRQRRDLRGRQAASSFSITSPAARTCRKRSPRSSRAWPKAACRRGCSLVGGETAEHPGVMPEDDYDLAGFTVGVVDKSKILDNSTMQPGDVLIALPSTGVHSNGFSLVRKVFGLDEHPEVLDKQYDELGCTLGEALLTPTRIYVKPVLAVMQEVTVKGVSHITGGGFYENIPRSRRTAAARASPKPMCAPRRCSA